MVSVMAVIIIIQRTAELYIAQKNYIRALKSGAQEFGSGHYPLFFLLHIGWFIGWVIEASAWGTVNKYSLFFFSLFLVAQGLRYWCMLSLGPNWNTRILVIPGQLVITKGPYKYLSHPNYLAVAIELVSVPAIFGVYKTAVIATILNAILILGIRLPHEKRALKLLKHTRK